MAQVTQKQEEAKSLHGLGGHSIEIKIKETETATRKPKPELSLWISERCI